MMSFLALIIAQPATAQVAPDVIPYKAVLYADPNFSGTSWGLSENNPHFASDLNDTVSSSETFGAQIELCEHPDYTGECVDSSFETMSMFDDAYTSMRFSKSSENPYIILWEHPNYTGRSRLVLTSDNDLRIGGSVAGFDDTMSSIEVVLDAKAKICEHPNGGGACVELTDSVPDLRTIGMDDAVSSVLATHPHAVLFQHPNYGGDALLVSGLQGALAVQVGLPGETSFNDQASSIAVYGGAEVTLREHPWHGIHGKTHTTTTSIPDLRTVGMDDLTSVVSFSHRPLP